MRRLILVLTTSVLVVTGLLIAFSWRSSDTLAGEREYLDEEIPEVEGDYKIKDRPLRVKVFVHKDKGEQREERRERRRNHRRVEPVLACPLADPDSLAVTGAAGWKLPGEWTYRLNVSSVPSSVGGSNLPTITTESFNKWNGAAGDVVSFTQGTNTSKNRRGFDGQNIVAWGRTSGSTLGVTYIWYYPATGLAAEIDTIMNQRVKWSWTPYSADACPNPDTYDAYNILIHELGHWMGLDDHYAVDYVDNTMYGYGSKGEIKKDTLTSGDSAGVYDVYH